MFRIKELGFVRWLDMVTGILLIFGGIVWGFGAIFGAEEVVATLGKLGGFSRIIYFLVGLSAIYEALMWKAIPQRWCEFFTGHMKEPQAETK